MWLYVSFILSCSVLYSSCVANIDRTCQDLIKGIYLSFLPGRLRLRACVRPFLIYVYIFRGRNHVRKTRHTLRTHLKLNAFRYPISNHGN
ncbi:hypothetical protein EJ02DRAFT_13727 [Clathrospora elynae]|uniref:Secreted protein n=1 Tax=Clathrospora elynae TaxID=706981 RepID=A0A6A5TAL4_9PLEO|nr:hypothetical protein EJ02DRAFT_13727 [Clathrospora elynae]